ncbi:hypothetical protein [Neptunomonas sp. XY-337]|uniref:hypothetical protein n=1 Tax=Neptunomonas sp. XY-337 TaxID=2561897 RepID=UPI0010AAD2A2|nr:hypothetical protein [Neptunomonas sp. XY-337]
MSTDGEYFVMLTTQSRSYTPLMDSNTDGTDIARFDSEQEARAAAENSLLGEIFCYEVFQVGMGL